MLDEMPSATQFVSQTLIERLRKLDPDNAEYVEYIPPLKAFWKAMDDNRTDDMTFLVDSFMSIDDIISDSTMDHLGTSITLGNKAVLEWFKQRGVSLHSLNSGRVKLDILLAEAIQTDHYELLDVLYDWFGDSQDIDWDYINDAAVMKGNDKIMEWIRCHEILGEAEDVDE